MKKVYTFIIALCCYSFAANAQTLDKWQAANPGAANAIAYWIKENPVPAHAICDWDAANPTHSQAFFEWSIANVGRDARQFCQMHNEWTELSDVLTKNRAATAGFAKLCCAFKDAMKELMSHPGGLKWAGDNLKVPSGN